LLFVCVNLSTNYQYSNIFISDCQDLVTCGICGRKYPLKQLSAFIKHKALGTCGRRDTPKGPEADLTDKDDSSSDSSLLDGSRQAAYKSLRSPSVSGSQQAAEVERRAALADSSVTEEEEEEEGVRRTSASSTSCLLDAATNTSSDTGEKFKVNTGIPPENLFLNYCIKRGIQQEAFQLY
jgi:hypothetical protein